MTGAAYIASSEHHMSHYLGIQPYAIWNIIVEYGSLLYYIREYYQLIYQSFCSISLSHAYFCENDN